MADGKSAWHLESLNAGFWHYIVQHGDGGGDGNASVVKAQEPFLSPAYCQQEPK